MLVPLVSPWIGLLLLVGFGALTLIACHLLAYDGVGFQDQFTQAGRNVSLVPGALSSAATASGIAWPLLAGAIAYTTGRAGIYWLILAAAIGILYFARAANRLRNRAQQHDSLSGFIGAVYGRPAEQFHLILQLLATTLFIAIQLRLGAAIFAAWLGWPPILLAALFAALALFGSLDKGAAGTIPFQALTMVVFIICMAALGPWAVQDSGGLYTLLTGFEGTHASTESLLSQMKSLALPLGIPLFVTFIGGVYALPALWQRAYALQPRRLRASFAIASLLLLTPVLGMSILGFIAAGRGGEVAPPWIVAPLVLQTLLSRWAVVGFAIGLLGMLLSTLDAHLQAIASTTTLHALFTDNFVGEKRAHRAARLTAYMLLIPCIILAMHLYGSPIHWLFLAGGLGAIACMPIVITLYDVPRTTGRFIAASVTGLLAGCLPLLYGILAPDPTIMATGAALALLLPGLIMLPRGATGRAHLAERLRLREEAKRANASPTTGTMMIPHPSTEPDRNTTAPGPDIMPGVQSSRKEAASPPQTEE